MQNSVMMVAEENDGTKNIISSNSRLRAKKKSTLTKLKQRKQKELGSRTSLNKEKMDATTFLEKEDDSSYKPVIAQNISNESQTALMLHSAGDAQMVDLDEYSFPTRDHLEEHLERPRPKPRGRRQSSDMPVDSLSNKIKPVTQANDNKEISIRKHDSSEETTIQMFKNLKMDNDQSGSIEPTISQSSFIPKPPSTPRKPRSNPRTPRGFFLAGKEEKRLREPWSSGDEPDVEEKKEKSNRINHVLKSADSKEIVEEFNFANKTDPTNDIVNDNLGNPLSSSEVPEKSIYKPRLKRGSSVSSLQGDLQDITSIEVSESPKYNILTPSQIYKSDSAISKQSLNSSTSKLNGSSVQESLQGHSLRQTILPRSIDSSGHLHQKPDSYISESEMKIEGSSHLFNISHLSINTYSDNDGSSNHEMTDNALHRFNEQFLTNTYSNGHYTETLDTSESSTKIHSVPSSSRAARLVPISPRSQPPSLPEDLSSRSLRTMYKIDPDVYSKTGLVYLGAGVDKSDSGTISNGDRLSQRSFTSTSVLPVITTKEARSRSGRRESIIGGSPSTLGTDELDRYFPERKVSIFVGTWNMNEQKDVRSSLDDFILPEKCDYVQDIYAIGTQENSIHKKEWEIKVQETLGPSHVMFHSASLGSLHLAVYIRRDLTWFCSYPEDDAISLRSVTMIKTKGAVGICFTLFGTSYLFINCHLTSDTSNETTRKKSRLQDYYKVISEMKLPKLAAISSTSEKPMDVTTIFDCMFWFGDLNFRIERKRHVVERKVNQISSEEFPHFETLLGGDQLLNYMAEGKIFGGFQEGRINFNPTFKFDLDTDTYDSSSKNRVPSYTDRIMFRSKKKHDITCTQYDAVMSVKTSDHRPVYGIYETAIKPGTDNVTYSVGHFDRSVYTEGIRRRTEIRPKRKKQSVVCAIQ